MVIPALNGRFPADTDPDALRRRLAGRNCRRPGQPDAAPRQAAGDHRAWLVRAKVTPRQMIPRTGPAAKLRRTGAASASAREVEVLGLLAAGKSNPAIAEELVITLDTVKRHVTHILDKLGAANRTQAVTRARELGLLR
jgi:ATP/maltotriose-dependent transcriptional regulator MalT